MGAFDNLGVKVRLLSNLESLAPLSVYLKYTDNGFEPQNRVSSPRLADGKPPAFSLSEKPRGPVRCCLDRYISEGSTSGFRSVLCMLKTGEAFWPPQFLTRYIIFLTQVN